MSLIKNLVKESEHKPKKKKKDGGSGGSDSDDKDKPLRPFVKTATDLQRLKLEKLMKNPVSLDEFVNPTHFLINNWLFFVQDKPVVIPEQRRERDYMSSVPSFVRNVMGSSAGAGSGEFHVYRHLRRKEYARQKNIQNQSAREAADDAYQQKLDDNRRAAEEKTAKKRAKRLKKKQRAKKPREHKKPEAKEVSESSGSDSEDEKAGEEARGKDEAEEAVKESNEEPSKPETTDGEPEANTDTSPKEATE
ncbi:hypothetical protein KR054_006421, partial [Drosophila jambulina]